MARLGRGQSFLPQIHRALVLTISAAIGVAAGTSTATATGISTVASIAESAGTSTVSGVGISTSASVGASTGTSSVSGIGRSTTASVSSSTGTSTVSGIGISTAASPASSAGTSTVAGISLSTAASPATSAGVGATSGIGSATSAAVGSSTGSSTATANTPSLGVGASSGTGTALAVGTVVSVGASAGTSTATAVGRATFAAVGASTGTSTAAAVPPGATDNLVFMLGSATLPSGTVIASRGATYSGDPLARIEPAGVVTFAGANDANTATDRTLATEVTAAAPVDDQLTRPADTTAYAAGDLIANSVTAGSVVPLAFAGATKTGSGGSGKIVGWHGRKSDAGAAQIRAHFLKTAHAVTNGDNGALLFTSLDVDNYLGAMDVTFTALDNIGASAGSVSQTTDPPIPYVLGSGDTIYVFLQAVESFTPVSAAILGGRPTFEVWT